jgi:hypothetical protein
MYAELLAQFINSGYIDTNNISGKNIGRISGVVADKVKIDDPASTASSVWTSLTPSERRMFVARTIPLVTRYSGVNKHTQAAVDRGVKDYIEAETK